MWSVNTSPHRLQRTSSINSFISDRSSNASSEDLESFLPRGQSMWGAPPTATQENFQQQSTVARLSQKFGNAPNVQITALPSPPQSREQSRPREALTLDLYEDETRSRSSTLGGEESELEFPLKTPTPDSIRLVDFTPVEETREYLKDIEESSQKDEEPAPPPRVPGPLELQLQALMSKLVFMEQENPLVSVTPEEYRDLEVRAHELEVEDKAWKQRYEALFALRDEDLANIVKTRGLLAKARRDLEDMTRLRDEDLVNVQVVRVKLAEATRKLETQQPASGRDTPTSRRGRPSSLLLERRDTTDLFAAAKAAALEQRTLELEKRNEDLIAQLEKLKSSQDLASASAPAPPADASIDTLNSVAAHKAWKETVSDLNAQLKTKDDEIKRLRTVTFHASSAVQATSLPAAPLAQTSLAPGSYDWHRVEALHEEHASYREKVGGRMQRLRAEKEELQKELHRKEDECHGLEAKVRSLERRVGVV